MNDTMKTPKEILEDFGITEKTKHHNYNYLYKSMLLAMEIYHEQKLNLSGIGSKRLFTEEDMEKSFNAGCAHRYTDTMKQWNASVKVFPRFKEWIKNFQAACDTAKGGSAEEMAPAPKAD